MYMYHPPYRLIIYMSRFLIKAMLTSWCKSILGKIDTANPKPKVLLCYQYIQIKMTNVNLQYIDRILPKCVLVLVFLLLTLGTSFAQDNGKKILLVVDDSIPIEMQKMSNDVDIKIDGKIDENVWKELGVYDPYKVTNPDTLEETIYQTKTRFIYTTEGLYVSM